MKRYAARTTRITKHTALTRGFHTVLLLLLLAPVATLVAQPQEAYVESWTIQDKDFDLRQELARRVIDSANTWRTRDDITLPTARLDDPLQVTVLVSVNPATGKESRQLMKLVMGKIVVDQDFERFLPRAILDSLVRRNCFWRNQQFRVLNEAWTPHDVVNYDPSNFRPDPYDLTFHASDNLPPRQLSLFETTYKTGKELRVWAGVGYDDLGFPAASYGKIRAGAGWRNVRFWGEIPLPFGMAHTALFARGLDATAGVGLSFEGESFGGALTWSDPTEAIGSAPLLGDTTWAFGRSALVYGLIPLGRWPLGDGYLRTRLGLTYTQAVQRIHRSEGEPVMGVADDHFKALIKMEYCLASDSGTLRRSVGLQLLTELSRNAWMLAWHEQFTDAIGLQTIFFGAFGAREPYRPEFSVALSPVIRF